MQAMNNNAAKLAGLLTKCGVDALLITSYANRFYATGFPSSAGTAVILPDKQVFMTDSRYIEAAERIEGFDILMTDAENRRDDIVNRLIGEHGIKRLGVEDESLSAAEFDRLEKALKCELAGIGGALLELRSSKEQWEIEAMRKAQGIAELALEETLKIIKPGVTENNITAELIYRMLLGGAEKVSFEPIVVSGANSSMPHGQPSDKRIEPGDFVTMDFGCVYGGYCSDMTRTVAVGHATDEMRKVYQTVLEAQLAGIAAAKAGIVGSEIDSAGRRVIEQAGYGEYFGHSFGHSLGIEIHELPNAAPSEKRIMPAGAVVSAEPGIYLPGKFGVRIEDVIVLKENGCENLTGAKKDLIIL